MQRCCCGWCRCRESCCLRRCTGHPPLPRLASSCLLFLHLRRLALRCLVCAAAGLVSSRTLVPSRARRRPGRVDRLRRRQRRRWRSRAPSQQAPRAAPGRCPRWGPANPARRCGPSWVSCWAWQGQGLRARAALVPAAGCWWGRAARRGRCWAVQVGDAAVDPGAAWGVVGCLQAPAIPPGQVACCAKGVSHRAVSREAAHDMLLAPPAHASAGPSHQGGLAGASTQAAAQQLLPIIEAEVERYRALWHEKQLSKLRARDHITWHRSAGRAGTQRCSGGSLTSRSFRGVGPPSSRLRQ